MYGGNSLTGQASVAWEDENRKVWGDESPPIRIPSSFSSASRPVDRETRLPSMTPSVADQGRIRDDSVSSASS